MKRPGPGKCVHCLSDPVERNWDHVFPEAWYPDTTPPNLSKWQIPSCIPCNRSLGEIENDLLIRIAFCLDPNAPESQSIVHKALRALRPKEGKTERDRNARAALAKRMSAEFCEGKAIPKDAIYPTLVEKWGRPLEEQVAVRIPAESLRKVTEKIVRGIFFLEDKKFIELPYCVQFYALDDAGAEPARVLLARFGDIYAREPGVVVRRAVTPDDGISSVFEIEFWRQFKTHAAVIEEPPNKPLENRRG